MNNYKKVAYLIFFILIMFISGLMYKKLPIDEFKNSTNIEKVVHAVIIIISGLIIFLYSYAPLPKIKGFALVILVMFLNTIAILYGAKDTGIAPGLKLARVIKWLLYILLVVSIIWYNTYGTIGSYTFSLDWLPFNLYDELTEDVRERTTEKKAKDSEEEERREISQDYYD
jgi:hypothetical protein